MKKLFIFPAFLLLISSGVTSNSPVRVQPSVEPVSVPVSTSLDSLKVRVIELNSLAEQL